MRTHLSARLDVPSPAGHEQHKRLLALFRKGDFVAFDALMREHVAGTRESYVRHLQARRAG